MNDHVPKPIEPEDLWKALLKWIKPRHSTAALPEAEPQPLPHAEGALPSAIDGVDMVTGLRRALGKKPLYLSMLRKFEAGQRSTIEEIAKLLDDNDWDSAERRAHTLKGVSGNIGAVGLQRLAEGIETAIRERLPREEINTRIGELKIPLGSLIAQLQQKLPEMPAKKTVPINRHDLKRVLDRLETLLTNNDSEAVDVLDANADLLYTAFPDHYRKIEDGIRSFNFEVALAALRATTDTST